MAALTHEQWQEATDAAVIGLDLDALDFDVLEALWAWADRIATRTPATLLLRIEKLRESGAVDLTLWPEAWPAPPPVPAGMHAAMVAMAANDEDGSWEPAALGAAYVLMVTSAARTITRYRAGEARAGEMREVYS